MELNLQTPLGLTGYGVAGLNIAKALHSLGVKVNAQMIGTQAHINNTQEHQFISGIVENGKIFGHDCPSLKIWHQFALGEHYGKGLYVGMPIFELNKFNELEKHHLKFPDRLYVNSRWAKDIINEEVGHRNVEVIPLGVDSSTFYPIDTERDSNQPYVFLNMGKMTINKGHDVLVEMFNKAFDTTHNVELWMVPHNPFYSQQEMNDWLNLYKNSPLGHKIRIFPQLKTHQNVAELMRKADCGIFPARGEGFNLELLEMLAVGKPCIATNYSGHTEYCTDENTHLIDIDNLEDAYDGKWFNGQGQWAELGSSQIDQAVNHMRYCYNNHPKNEEGIKTGKEFSWTNSAQEIINDIF